MARAIKLGFVGLNGIKTDELQEHYTQILGLPLVEAAQGAQYYSCGPDHHSLIIEKSDRKGLSYFAIQIAGEGPMDDVAKELTASGIKNEVVSDRFKGVGTALKITDPDGFTIYLYRHMERSEANYSGRGIGPQKLGHVALFSKNAQTALDFYTECLSFRWSDWVADAFVFMRCNADHHVINFINRTTPGMFHFAYELRDSAHLIQACDQLGMHRIPIEWGPGRHGPGHNLYTYHLDPDGNVVELFADLDRMSNEELGCWDPRPHHRNSPQRPQVWDLDPKSECWGPPVPELFKVK